jgi:iron complex outermembrane recepter protein
MFIFASSMKLFFTFSILFLSILAKAQIKGVVLDAQNKAIKGASVQILNPSDSTQVEGGLTNTDGEFELQNNKKLEIFLIKIKYLGFDTKIISSKNITPKIILQQSNATTLGEIEVVSKKDVTKFTADKKIYNAGSDLTGAGGAASDILKNVPGVNINPSDGKPSIRGNDNVGLLIDGKPSVQFGDDIASALQSLPGSSIASVEVINNPGAQYDAQGKAGLINIILKKERKPGYNGQVGLVVGYPYKLNLNINANANVKKWNYFINASGRTANTWIKEKIERTNNSDTSYYTNSYTNRIPKNGNINFGADYTANNFNKFSLSQSIFRGDMGGDVTTDLSTITNIVPQVARTNRINNYNGHPRNGTTTFNYTHNFKKPNTELKIDASGGISRYTRSSDFNTIIYNQQNNIVSNGLKQTIPVKGGSENVTISSDLTMPILQDNKLDIGVKYINFAFHSENFPTIQLPNGPINIDGVLKNKFNFNQITYAAYTNYKIQYKKYSVQTGLRYENFKYDGFVYQYNKGVAANFSNLFPSIFINKKLNQKSDITLSYNKRVNRPNFFQLVPYIDVTNPQDTSIGNADLKPEFIHATELNYNTIIGAKNSLLASVYYQYNANLIQRYKVFNANGTTRTQPQNLNNGITFGAELNYKHFFNKNFDASVNLNVFNNIIKGGALDANINTSGYSGFAKIISNYKLNNKYDCQLTGNYQAPAIVAQGRTKAYYNADIAVKRNLLKNLMTLTLTANDIFNTQQLESVYNLPNVYSQYNYKKTLSQQISIGVQMRFASKSMRTEKPKEFKKAGKPENKDVKNRDENLKKDEKDEDSGGGNNTNNK